MVKLVWLPNWHAYAVHIDGVMRGMVRLRGALPFSESECQVEFE